MGLTKALLHSTGDPSASREDAPRLPRLRVSPEQATAIANLANTARCDAVEIEDQGDCVLVRRFDVKGGAIDELLVYPADEEDDVENAS